MIAWENLKGNWKVKLFFQFVRIQIHFPPWPKWIGMSVFVHTPIKSVDSIHATLWNLPFTPKFVEVKYHYSHNVKFLGRTLISFSVRRDSVEPGGFNDKVKELDGKKIRFSRCRVNSQPLEGFSGEVYPEDALIYGRGIK